MASQTITGKDLQFTKDNKHCYAYSGVIGVTNAETSMVETKAGDYYAVVKIQFSGNYTTGHNYEAKVYLDDVIALEFLMSAVDDAAPLGYFPFNLIIPSNTKLKITLANLTSSASNNWDVQVTGRVYDYLPVRN